MNYYEPIIEVNPFRGSQPERSCDNHARHVLPFDYLKSTDLIIALRIISNVRSEDIKFD
jgi:hypothetical protein